ncbi:MAG TPA: hypothetical protein VFU11_12115 [Solirubrobacterales bacterium]|nr:hypothetical protein [Solirubrobacterales bacterium]
MRFALVPFLLLVLGASVAQAAPPANDNFAGAAPLTAGTELSSSNLEATAEPGEPNTAEDAKHVECAALSSGPDCASSVWYRFQPAVGGQYTVETCDLGSDLASEIGVFTGSEVGSATQIASSADWSDCAGGLLMNGSRVTFTATAGTVYHLAVVGFHGDQGSFYLRAYTGGAQPRPEPDTGIEREDSSFVEGLLPTSLRAGVVSGPRHSASFALISSGQGASYECALDGAAFSPCASPVSYPGLAAGSSHTFAARAVLAGTVDPTPALQRFSIDLTAPETTLISGPVGNTASQSATWTVASSERNAGRYGYLCGIDGAVVDECTRSFGETSLCRGTHTFSAAAVDSAGNVDPTPVRGEVDVTTGAACLPPTTGEPFARNVTPTNAELVVDYQNKGPRGSVRFEYGTTAAYGFSLPLETALTLDSAVAVGVLRFLDPGTTYHYRVTVSTPAGTVSSGDRTFSTSPLTGTLPGVAVGTPSVAEHVATIPATITPRSMDTHYEMRISKVGSPDAAVIGGGEVSAAVGAAPVRIEVVDLDPCTTYRYRIVASHRSTDENEVASPAATFTTTGKGNSRSLPAQASPKAKAKGLLKCQR